MTKVRSARMFLACMEPDVLTDVAGCNFYFSFEEGCESTCLMIVRKKNLCEQEENSQESTKKESGFRSILL